MTSKHTLPILLLCFIFQFSCEQNNNQNVLITGNTMGTTYNIKYLPNNATMNSELVQQDIDKQLIVINSIMSTYDPESELSILNKNTTKQCISISDSLFEVIEQAIKISDLSQGSFDITVAPLVELWGFGPNGIPIEIPSEESITQAKSKTGFQNLILDHENSCVQKTIPELTIDLSAIAKGYAVDEVSDRLESLGLKNFMVEIGGEIKARGLNIKQMPWQIGIEKPTSNDRSVQKIISLKNKSMATSGDYRNYFEHQGQQYSHLIDASTGKPIKHDLVSVTVLHESCTIADALATAYIVMGYNKAYELAEAENMAVLFISMKEDEFIESATSAFSTVLH